MFNNKNEQIESYKQQIEELKKQLNEVAEANGNVIIKQLPNGEVELNGFSFDNTTDVEYYNSSKATYGELTMFRVGKEVKQRELDKLVKIHMDQVDSLNKVIEDLRSDNSSLQNDISCLNAEKSELEDKLSKCESINKQLAADKEVLKHDNFMEVEALKKRYDDVIKYLEEDIKEWKNRCLTLNNVKMDGTIITNYGKIFKVVE